MLTVETWAWSNSQSTASFGSFPSQVSLSSTLHRLAVVSFTKSVFFGVSQTVRNIIIKCTRMYSLLELQSAWHIHSDISPTHVDESQLFYIKPKATAAPWATTTVYICSVCTCKCDPHCIQPSTCQILKYLFLHSLIQCPRQHYVYHLTYLWKPYMLVL